MSSEGTHGIWEAWEGPGGQQVSLSRPFIALSATDTAGHYRAIQVDADGYVILGRMTQEQMDRIETKLDYLTQALGLSTLNP